MMPELIFAGLFIILLVFIVGKLLLQPFKLAMKIVINSIFGLLLLWAYNFIGAFIHFEIPINWLTVLVAGFFGIPGLVVLIIVRFIIGG